MKSDAVRIELVKALLYSENQATVINTINSFLSSEYGNENLIIESLKALQVKEWDEVVLNDNRIKNPLKKLRGNLPRE